MKHDMDFDEVKIGLDSTSGYLQDIFSKFFIFSQNSATVKIKDSHYFY